MKVVSFNIKCDDTIADIQPEFLWNTRKEKLTKQIQKFDADLIGMQEVMPHQYDFFNQKLSEKYDSIYRSRDDNAPNGEGSPVFYDKNKFSLIESKTFWLSESPNTPASTSWNSRWPRICTYVILKDNQSGKEFAFFNTHLDHKSPEARVGGIKLILSVIKKYNLPTILTGDFNSSFDTDVFKLCSSELTYANEKMDKSITFHLFGQPEVLPDYIRNIDYIFVKDMIASDYKVLNDFEDATNISDHYAIQANVDFLND